jgi:hypothetical protein
MQIRLGGFSFVKVDFNLYVGFARSNYIEVGQYLAVCQNVFFTKFDDKTVISTKAFIDAVSTQSFDYFDPNCTFNDASGKKNVHFQTNSPLHYMLISGI